MIMLDLIIWATTEIHNTFYNSAGFDRDGNFDSGAGGSGPSWDTTPYDLTFTQNQSGSETAFTATADPYTNTINYSLSGGTAGGAGLSIDSTSGELTGYFTSVNTYTATITATDTTSNKFISENIDITVTRLILLQLLDLILVGIPLLMT